MRIVLSASYDVTLIVLATIRALASTDLTTTKRKLSWLKQRLRCTQINSEGDVYWVHGVSAGETKVAINFIRFLALADSAGDSVISSSTPAGFAAAANALGQSRAFVMPLDTRRCVDAAFRQIKPSVLVLVESEIWPQLLCSANRHKVPVVIISGRMSDKTFSRIQKLPGVAKRLLILITHFFVQDIETFRRLSLLGVDKTKITVTGNLKLAPSDDNPLQRKVTTDVRQVLAFGNVHPAELDLLIPVVLQARNLFPDLSICIVPRHPEKFTRKKVSARFPCTISFLDDIEPTWRPTEGVTWINKMGVLGMIYGNANIAVVGGTFCDVGGHDLVEPLHRGAISIYGPNIKKQKSLHDHLRNAPYGIQVDDPIALLSTIERILTSPEYIAHLSEQAETDFLRYRQVAADLAESVVTIARSSANDRHDGHSLP